MAPSRIDYADTFLDAVHGYVAKPKDNMNPLEDFPEAIRHGQCLFTTILPKHPKAKYWRENAEAIFL